MTFPPYLVAVFENAEKADLAAHALIEIWGSDIIKFYRANAVPNAFSLLFSYQVVGYRLVKQYLRPYADKLYGGSREMEQLSVEPLGSVYEEFYFTYEQHDEVCKAQAAQYAVILDDNLTYPMLAILTACFDDGLRDALYYLYNNGFLFKTAHQGACTVVGMLYARNVYTKRRILEFFDKNIICCEISANYYTVKGSGYFVLPSTFRELLFTRAEFDGIYAAELARALDQHVLPEGKIGPNLVVYCGSEQQFLDIFSDLGSIDERRILLKQFECYKCFYLSAIFNSNVVKSDLLWYCIYKDIKRFIRTHPILYAPSICPKLAFYELLFDQADYDAIYSENGVQVDYPKQPNVGPRAIIYFRCKEELDAFVTKLYEKFGFAHIYTTSFLTKIGFCYLGLLFDDSIIQPSTIKYLITEQMLCVFENGPMQAPPEFVSSYIFSKLLFLRGIYKAITELGIFYRQKRPAGKHNTYQTVSKQEALPHNPVLYFIDFEAYFYTQKEYHPSEFAIVRVDHGDITASCHAFFNYPIAWFDNLSQHGKQHASFVYRLTHIPLPHKSEYSQLKFKVDCATLSDLLVQIYILSSEYLVQQFGDRFDITILKNYDAPLNRFHLFCAKGIQLESLIFKNLLKCYDPIVEYMRLAKELCSSESYDLKDIHSPDRFYAYCAFHYKNSSCNEKREMTHCALDDAMYIATKYVKGYDVERDTTVEPTKKQESEVSGELPITRCVLNGDQEVAYTICYELQAHGIAVRFSSDNDSHLLVVEGVIEKRTLLAFCGTSLSCTFV